MRYHALVPLAAALANLMICVPVLRHGARNREHRTFAWLTLTIACWNLDVFSLYYFTDATAAEWWSRVFRVGMCLCPPALLHTAVVISDTNARSWRLTVTAAYAVGAVLAVANVFGALVRDLTPHLWGWYIVPAPLYSLLTVLILACLALSIEREWYTYRRSSSPRRRAQAKFWLVGGALQAVFISTNLLPIYGVNIYPLGNLGNVIWTGSIAYVIVRHRLMDLDYVVRRSISFLVAAGAVLIPGGLGLAALCRELAAQAPVVIVCASVTLAVVAVILVPALQEALETRLHRALFPRRYDRRLRLRQVAGSLVHILSERELLERLGEALRDILNVDVCEIFVRDEESPRLRRAFPTGTDEMLPDDLVPALEAVHGSVLVSELDAQRHVAARLFRERRWEVALSLRISERLTGVLAVGVDRDMRIPSGEDLELLETVAASATIALENARLSRQLRRSEVVLERATRLSSLGVLAAGIAHEIRNPLVAVKTFLDLLPSRLEDPEFLTQFRTLSLTELRRVTDLISDMLALGKSTNTERRTVELGDVVDPVVRLMDSTARKRGVELVAHVEQGLPPVWADPDQLKQILLNLVLNAIEASPPESRVAIDAYSRWAGRDEVVVEVRDQGAGIPPDQLETIFHPFFTTKESGTGLGLALVHQMVVEHGGEAVVESKVGTGSTFRVSLPAIVQDLQKTGS